MEINGEIFITGTPTVTDIDQGECFTFQDSNVLLYRGGDEIFELASGEYVNSVYNHDIRKKPVYRVQAEVNIIKVYV